MIKGVKGGVSVEVFGSLGWCVNRCVGAGVVSADGITVGIDDILRLIYSHDLFDGLSDGKTAGSLLYESLEKWWAFTLFFLDWQRC